MDSYKAYRMYKTRYLGLGGGEKTFTVYTTGLADLGHNDRLITLWSDYMRSHVVTSIPQSYDICIKHFDPSDNIHQELIDNMIAGDIHVTRVDTSEFIRTAFDHTQVVEGPHIVIDFAHIYAYDIHTGQPYIATPRGPPLPIKALHIGYEGRFADGQLLRVSEDGRVVTYIDKMVERGVTFDPIYLFNWVEGKQDIERLRKELGTRFLRQGHSIEAVDTAIKTVFSNEGRLRALARDRLEALWEGHGGYDNKIHVVTATWQEATTTAVENILRT